MEYISDDYDYSELEAEIARFAYNVTGEYCYSSYWDITNEGLDITIYYWYDYPSYKILEEACARIQAEYDPDSCEFYYGYNEDNPSDWQRIVVHWDWD